MRPYITHLLVFLVGTTAGALPFLLPTPDAPEAPALVAYNAGERDAAHAGNDTLAELQAAAEAGSQSCQETLLLTQRALASTLEELNDARELSEHLSDLVDRTSGEVPMDFPAELDEAFRPENFQQAVEQLMQECPDLFPPETRVNCDEYPCAIEFPLNVEGEPREAWRFDYNKACPAIATHFGHATRQPMVSRVGEETRVQYMVHGTGIGLDKHLREHRAKLQQRIQERWHAQRRAMVKEQFDDACLSDGDPTACREVANAHWNDPEARNPYLQRACDADDAASCNNLAWERCYGAGNCDATAEAIARQAVDLDPDDGNILHTLGVVLCQRGQPAAAARTWQSACNIGHDLSCTEICSP